MDPDAAARLASTRDDGGFIPIERLALESLPARNPPPSEPPTQSAILEAVRLLYSLDPKATEESMAIHMASANGNIAFVKAMLDVDSNAWQWECDGDIPLGVALLRRKLGVAQELVSREVPDPGLYLRILSLHNGERGVRPLIVTVVRGIKAPLGDEVWAHVPRQCQKLSTALGAVMTHAPKEKEKLMTKVPQRERRSVQAVLCVMARHLWSRDCETGMKKHLVLPVALEEKILKLAFS